MEKAGCILTNSQIYVIIDKSWLKCGSDKKWSRKESMNQKIWERFPKVNGALVVLGGKYD